MMSKHTNKLVLAITVIICIAVTIAIFTGPLTAQAQVPLGQASTAKSDGSKVAFKVGTYNPQTAFEQHPLQKKLMEKYNSLQAAIQEAQQEGDQQKAMQLQQQFEQQRTQIIEQFQQDVEKALPEAAEAADVKVIALEIAYTADDVKTQDVTAHIVETFTEKDENKSAEPQFQFPGQ